MNLLEIMRPGLLARMDKSGKKLYHRMGYKGQNCIVGIIDTGVNEHQELKGKLLAAAPDPSVPFAKELPVGHGTNCATKIAGTNIGEAPECKLLPYARKDAYLDSVVAGLKFMRAWRGPKGEKVNIVSLSVSSLQNYAGLGPEVKACWDAGILIVCSSGNSGIRDVVFPASLDETLSVGAADNSMQPVGWHTYGAWLDVIQNGDNVVVGEFDNPEGYTYRTGTSFSTPSVAGIAALIVSKYFAQNGKHPTPAVLKELILFNTIDAGIVGPDVKSGVGYCTLDPHMPAIIEMTVNSSTMQINGYSKTLDQPPEIDGDTWRTLVPVRAVSEAFGADVRWDADKQLITIEGVRA